MPERLRYPIGLLLSSSTVAANVRLRVERREGVGYCDSPVRSISYSRLEKAFQKLSLLSDPHLTDKFLGVEVRQDNLEEETTRDWSIFLTLDSASHRFLGSLIRIVEKVQLEHLQLPMGKGHDEEVHEHLRC